MRMTPHHSNTRDWRGTLHEIIFEADTRAGKVFDVGRIVCILLSVLIVMLDSVTGINKRVGSLLYGIEWGFTLLFTVEYILRLVSVGQPFRYATSFFGIVDLISILPTYISVFFPGTQYFLVIRLLRVLRVFRVFKLVQYVGESRMLMAALRASRKKIVVFVATVLVLVVIFGSLMYLIEGEANGFTSIPRSVYWPLSL